MDPTWTSLRTRRTRLNFNGQDGDCKRGNQIISLEKEQRKCRKRMTTEYLIFA
jgi:hypothetical protein